MMPEGDDHLASSDAFKQGTSLFTAASLEQFRCHHARGKEWLHRERLAQFAHDNECFSRARFEPAILLRCVECRQPHLGKGVPDGRIIAVLRCAIRVALLEAVAVLQQPRQAFAQHALFIGGFEIHLPQSPSIVLAMMFFWISFDPP
jgi:hypothetical protein